MREYIVTVDDDDLDYEEVFISYIKRQTELIRCKDCKHHRDDTRCNNRIGVWFDDDYCSDAERKEE
jgi:hypothetical protein